MVIYIYISAAIGQWGGLDVDLQLVPRLRRVVLRLLLLLLLLVLLLVFLWPWACADQRAGVGRWAYGASRGHWACGAYGSMGYHGIYGDI